MDIPQINMKMHEYFLTGDTRAIAFRKQQLTKLENAILQYKDELFNALQIDLNKSKREAYLTEIYIVLDEIKTARKHLTRWAKDKYIRPSLFVLPSKNYVHYEPLGCVLIIAPWNYPINLLLCPLVGAIAAGCCAMLKPSPYVPNVSHVLSKMIQSTFEPQYINIIEGHRDINTQLLNERWDLIFFTGSPTLAKTVMAAAAKYLTPCVLELGGKSPCIVDKDADLTIAAKRIAWGKLINRGQTCIAPDYLMVHTNVKDKFIEELHKAIDDLLVSQDSEYPLVHIVSEKAQNRLDSYLNKGNIQQLGPITIIDQEIEDEIFGPIFSCLSFSKTEEIIQYINSHEKSLALYYFGKESTGKQVINHTSSGGACINDTILHIVNPRLPFGGVGNSGMGKYHHKESFLQFSNRRAVVVAYNKPYIKLKDLPFKPLLKFFK